MLIYRICPLMVLIANIQPAAVRRSEARIIGHVTKRSLGLWVLFSLSLSQAALWEREG